jgi:hypothetical protein
MSGEVKYGDSVAKEPPKCENQTLSPHHPGVEVTDAVAVIIVDTMAALNIIDSAKQQQPATGSELKLTKHERNLCWKEPCRLIRPCDFCDRGFANAFFSSVFKFNDCYYFVCKACALSPLPSNFKRVHTNVVTDKRVRVWLSYNGLSATAKCAVCEITDLNAASSAWQACHKQAAAAGGSSGVENIIPGCSSCNYSMKTTALGLYKNTLNDLGLLPKTVTRLTTNVMYDNSTVDFLISSLNN